MVHACYLDMKSRALYDRVMLLKASRDDIEIIGCDLKKSATDDLAPPPISIQIVYWAARDQQLGGCAEALGDVS